MKEIEDIEAAQEDADRLVDLNDCIADSIAKALTPVRSSQAKLVHRSKLDVELEDLLDHSNVHC